MHREIPSVIERIIRQEHIDLATVRRLLTVEDGVIEQLLLLLREHSSRLALADENSLANVLATITERELTRHPKKRALPEEWIECVRDVYGALGGENPASYHLLSLLSLGKDASSLTALADLLLHDPPRNADHASVPMAFLIQRGGPELAVLFPRLLEGLSHKQLAAAILDVANHLTRSGVLVRNPVVGRASHLNQLLDGVVSEMESLVSANEDNPSTWKRKAEKTPEGIALIISLCDALAMCGDTADRGAIHRAMVLPHRRIQVEAASALARLGDEEGLERLCELAAEPVVRLRALTYAEELGQIERIPAIYRSLESRAEADFLGWLAQPSMMGIPPTKCELLDHRELYWPGFSDPVACYQFRFTYENTDTTYSNIGIAGPVNHSFTADLSDLSPDDIYAIYAGWHAEHQEISRTGADDWSIAQQADVVILERRLQDAGFREIHGAVLGSFFGENVLVAICQREGVPGVAVVDVRDLDWFPTSTTRRPLGPEEVFHLYKGRRVLRTFNPLE